MQPFGKIAAYTIIKNEIKHIKTWLYYTKDFDGRFLLDTGSTDGTWEYLQEVAKDDPTLIIEQKIFEPWDFSVARNYNINMIPKDYTWAASPDADEWFSINTFDIMDQIIKVRPDVTDIACTRLDIYSKEVFVGPPKHLGTNKIHKLFDENGDLLYKWKSKIYEHLSFQPKDRYEVELHSDEIFLVHNQDFLKPERSPLYVKMLIEACDEDPTDTWCGWFLTNHYFIEQDLENFIKTGCNFVKHHKEFDGKYNDVLGVLSKMRWASEVSTDLQQHIVKEIGHRIK